MYCKPKWKCILINLKTPDYGIKTAPQALAKLGGILKKRTGWEVHYLDEQVKPFDDLKKFIESIKPDFIGISAQAGSVKSLWNILECLECYTVQIPIIVGNLTATYAHKTILRKHMNIICSIGRGEITFNKIAEAVETSKLDLRITSIPNLVYYDKKKERLVTTQYVCSTNDIDCESDWDGLFEDINVSNYEEFWLESSHGCPHKKNNMGCIYCAIMPDGGLRNLKARKLDYVIKDFLALVNHGVKHIKLSDEEFMANGQARILEFVNRIQLVNYTPEAKNGFRTTFDFSTRVDDIIRFNHSLTCADESLSVGIGDRIRYRKQCLTKLKMAGLSQIYLGIESGNDAQLKRMHKGVTVANNFEAVRLLNELQIRIAGGWIMFDPFMENPEELLLNGQFLRKANLLPQKATDDFVTNTTGRMRVLVGAPVATMLEERGLLYGLRENLIEYDFAYFNSVIYSIISKLNEWETSYDHQALYRAKSIISIAGDDEEISCKQNKLIGIYLSLKKLDLEVCESLAFQATKMKEECSEKLKLIINSEFLRKRDLATKDIYKILKQIEAL